MLHRLKLKVFGMLKLDIKVKAFRMIGNSKDTTGGPNLFIQSHNEWGGMWDECRDQCGDSFTVVNEHSK